MEKSLKAEYQAQLNSVEILKRDFYKENDLDKALSNLFYMSKNDEDEADRYNKKKLFGSVNFSYKQAEEYFTELRRLLKDELSRQENLVIVAFRKNYFYEFNEYYSQFVADYKKNLDKMSSYKTDKLLQYNGQEHLFLADFTAKIWLTLATPQFEKAADKYWTYYNSLKELIKRTYQEI